MPKYAAVVGNPDMGYSLHGPFVNEIRARDWIEAQDIVEHSVCVMKLADPKEGYYEYDDEETTDGSNEESVDSDVV